MEIKNINISYGDKGDKNKFDTEILLNHLKNYVINVLISMNLIRSIINLLIL